MLKHEKEDPLPRPHGLRRRPRRGTIYFFRKVELPKQPLDTTPVAGTRLGQIGANGIAYITASGQLRLSLTSADGCFVSVNLTYTLDGDAFYNSIDGVTHTSNWTPRDCDSIVF